MWRFVTVTLLTVDEPAYFTWKVCLPLRSVPTLTVALPFVSDTVLTVRPSTRSVTLPMGVVPFAETVMTTLRPDSLTDALAVALTT